MEYTKEEYLKLLNEVASMERVTDSPSIMFGTREMMGAFDNFINNKSEELLRDIPKTVNYKRKL